MSVNWLLSFFGVQDLSYKDRHWHERCFKCCDCQVSLVDHPFACKNEKLYCADCHDNNFAARCDGCGGLFRAGLQLYFHLSECETLRVFYCGWVETLHSRGGRRH